MPFLENRCLMLKLATCIVLSICGLTLVFRPYLHEYVLLPIFSTVVCALASAITKNKSNIWKFSGMLSATIGTAFLFNWRAGYTAAIAAIALAVATTFLATRRMLMAKGMMRLPFALLAISGLAAGLAVLYGVAIARTFHYAGIVYALIFLGTAIGLLINCLGDDSWN